MPGDATTPHPPGTDPLDEGFRLATNVEDGGDCRPFLDWMARNPGRAAGVAERLAIGRAVREVMAVPAGETHIPGLELLEVIGRGSFGVVHRAHDPALRKDVAVKLVQVSGEADRARFQFEAQAAAGLDHPNVVPVYSSGEADGTPYLVMKFMPGGSLARWLQQKGEDHRLPPDEAAKLVRDIALGTHHAHQSGLIHRDLKPGNVLLTEDGSPRITDFGVACLADRSLELTRTGVIQGTPAYMAPEQARNDKRLTTAVDVHALGVILFELLAGTTPFAGDGVLPTLRRIEEEPAPALSSRGADVPADLESICRRCLEKRPEDRYPSALALADDLSRFLAGEPVDGQTRGVFEDVRRAFARIVPTRGIGTWPALFFGAANSTLSLAAVQAAVLLDAPPWVGWAALGCYFVGWMAIIWVVAVYHRHELGVVERGSLVVQFGMMFAALATLPAQVWLNGGAVAPTFAPFLAVVGLGLFISGGTFWGRLYLIGLLELALAALLPLVPLNLWPGLYCLTQFAVQTDLEPMRERWKTIHTGSACCSIAPI
ncbi:MAG: serine/threonine-protein kinase [Gemmataceae bacterium]